MRKIELMRETALRSVVAIGFALVATAANSQTTVPNSTSENPSQQVADSTTASESSKAIDLSDNNSSIIVTGSHIKNPNLISTVPVTAISGETFFQTGMVSIGDKLNQLPQLRSTFSTANSTRFLGTHGLNLLDLRGLGTQRTLVLVNGRRHVASDILANGVSVDTNTIPTDLIERVDVVTGGDSAIYGSDAIAGVVNFVLKDHYDGFQVRGQGGISKYGDAGSYYVSALAGRNFADGRGNVAINFEYARQNDYYGSDRPNTRTRSDFAVVDTDPAGSPNGSDGNPDRIFFNDIRSSTIANGGLLQFNSPTGACGRDASGAAFTCNYLFQPDGTLAPQTGTRVGIGPNGSFIGGNGSNLREGKQLVLQPRQDRYSGNLVAHYEISDALVPFLEAKYVRVNTTGSASGPAFFQGSTLDANLERPRLDNPFLTDQARALIISQMLAANPSATILPSTRFQLKRNLLDLGVRNEQSRRETYRIVGGLRGTFNEDWNYEIAGNYGVFKEATKVQGNLNVQRFLLGMDSTRDATGKIVCRSQINPAAGGNAELVDDAAVLAQDIAACVPINPFGLGNISDAARKYVIQDTTSHGKITQLDFSGVVSGNTSKWLNLPGGPIDFAVGGEYRRETNSFRADPLVEAGYTFYNALPSFSPPSFEVKEGFAEIHLPVLKDMFLAKNLTLTGAGRVANYKGSTGTVYAYNGGVDWSPVADFHLRANYAHAVRAPNLTELYAAQGQNFAPAPNDPCSARNIATGSSTRAANCAAAGIPASYDYVYTQSLEIVSGGNPNLKAEKSNSYTLGSVFTPRAVPGLSLSVDYYNITVDKVITSPEAQDILNACYDAASINNQFCGLFQRAGAGGGPKGEIQHQILEGSLLQTTLNYAKLKTSGIDTELAYRHSLGDSGSIDMRLTYTHVLSNNQFLNPVDPTRTDRLLGELGYPKDEFNWNVDLKRGPVTLNYQMRYISHMVLNTYENVFSVQGRPPENADYADRVYYPAVVYHNARIGIDASDKFNFYVGCDNITNRLPPLGLTGVTDGSGIYDGRGRFFYAGVVAKF
jgi:outer membrane receptor protein involved in Fe transport